MASSRASTWVAIERIPPRTMLRPARVTRPHPRRMIRVRPPLRAGGHAIAPGIADLGGSDRAMRTLGSDLVTGIPRLPPATVPRGRLIEHLDAQDKQPLTLVGAPAGSGKTVLLASWAAARGAAWLTLGPHHRDARRLWRDILASLSATGVELAIDPPEGALDDGFALRLADALAAAQTRPALVLDDLHVLRGPAVDAIGDLVAYGGNRLRLLVATRADPQLPLHRLRLQGRLGEVRTEALAFTQDEAAELFDGLGVALRPDQVARLGARTEGWAAGLRLAGVSLRGEPDPDCFVAGFAGDDRAVADYLTGEVLASQEPAVREFLLRTSVAERVCGELADALTGDTHGARMLADLERAGLFLVPLDRQGAWYRYHAVFAELLRARLRLEHPELERELHARAGSWLVSEGLAREALPHAVAAEDPAALGDLLAEHWHELLLEPAGAEAVVEAADLPGADERVVVAAASMSVCLGDPAGAEARLRGRDFGDGLVGDFAALLSARARGDVGACRRAADRLMARDDDAARVLALVHVGCTEFASGSPDAAREDFEAAAVIAAECGYEGQLLVCLGRTAALELVAGNLARAEASARAAIALAEPRGRLRGAAAVWALTSLAAVHWHRDELDDAERRADAAAAAAHARREANAVLAVRALRAHLAAASGDTDRARAVLRSVPRPAAGSLLERWLEALGPTPWAIGCDGMPVAGTAAAVAGGGEP